MPFTGEPFEQAKAAVLRGTHPDAISIKDIPKHLDDDAVDGFSAAMKKKLAEARKKGRGGWQDCSLNDLSRMLREHVEKGDPRDVANFCMFLWSLGYGIAPAPQPPAALPGEQDTARLDYLIQNRARVVSDDSCCDGYWLKYLNADGQEWVQITSHSTPREAIDSAIAAKGRTDGGEPA